jgi:hypothetical protein
MNNEARLEVEVPPRVLTEAEPAPVIEPPLRDLPPFAGSAVELWESVERNVSDHHLHADVVERARALALRDDKVQSRLAGKRHLAIGVSLREEKEAEAVAVAVFYIYDDRVTIEVTLDRQGEKVLSVDEADYQPAPLQEEIDEAVELARRDARLREVSEDLEGTAILVSPSDPADEHFGHRQFDVRFGCVDERLPRYAALVDLTTRSVVRVGPRGCGDELRQREEQR